MFHAVATWLTTNHDAPRVYGSRTRARFGLRRGDHRLPAAATTTPAAAAAPAPALPRGRRGGVFGPGRRLRLPGALLGRIVGGSRLDQPDGARATHLELLDAAQSCDEPRGAGGAPEAARLEGVRERID